MSRNNDEQPREGPYGRMYRPWLKDLPHMGDSEWRILHMLLEQLEFDEHGNATAWQPRAVMAESLGLSERQVSDAVRRLSDKGVLSVKRPGCNGHATVYNVMPGKPWPAELDPADGTVHATSD